MKSLVSQWVETRDGSIRTRYWSGPCPGGIPLVLVHGVVASSRYLLPVGRLLAPQFCVYIPDLPGYGRSTSTLPRLTVPDLADALVRWMDALRLERASLLANSFGCQIAVNLAARYADRVYRLVLLGPTVDPHAPSLSLQALRLARDVPHERLSLPVVLANDCINLGPRRIWAALGAMMADHIEDALPRVQAPALVVRGERDTVVPQRWAQEAAALLPRGRLAVLSAAPHAANYSAPHLLADVTGRFLRDQP